jgi:hypothetical protein
MYQSLNINGIISPNEFYNNCIVKITSKEDYFKHYLGSTDPLSKFDKFNEEDGVFLTVRKKTKEPEYSDFIFGKSDKWAIAYAKDLHTIRNNLYHIWGERNYYLNGRPYYKIYNQILPSMLNTTLDINVRDLKLPFNSFSIQLEEDNCTRIDCLLIYVVKSSISKTDDNKIDISTSSFTNFDEVQLLKKDNLTNLADDEVIRINMIGSYNNNQNSFISSYVIYPHELNMTLNDYLNKYNRIENFDFDMVKIVLSVCLLATGSHKMVEPDIMEHLLEAYRNKSTSKKRRAKIRKQSSAKHPNGFTIGRVDSQRRLPNGVKVRPQGIHDYEYYVARSPHVRCGHYRNQAFGEGWQNHRIIWLEPTIIHREENKAA